VTGTPAEQAPTRVVGALPPAHLDLLTAVLEALDIPSPATGGDVQAHDQILKDRVMDAVLALRGVLRGDDPGWSADYLRARLAEQPPTGYRHWGEGR
jgi:hypothetical protein